MIDQFINNQGNVIDRSEIKTLRAKAFIQAVQLSPYAELIQCRRKGDDSTEFVIGKIKIELGQIRHVDVRDEEIIGVVFDHLDNTTPDVFSLRKDIPPIPHFNLKEDLYPKSLCIYEEKYSERKLKWTASLFLEDIRNWFGRAAKGIVHAADQPLEAILGLNVPPVVIPEDLLELGKDIEYPIFMFEKEHESFKTLLYQTKRHYNGGKKDDLYVAMVVETAPQLHGVIHNIPKNLYELSCLLKTNDFNLLNLLRERLRSWYTDFQISKYHYMKLILTLLLPKRRFEHSDPESVEYRAFQTSINLAELGVDIGIWEIREKDIGLIINIDKEKVGMNTEFKMLNPTPRFSRKQALKFNDIYTEDVKKITLIGVGAIGSHLFLNLIRMGYGSWTLIDHDIFMPHNLARHGLDSWAIGMPKAAALANAANLMLSDSNAVNYILADLLEPKDNADAINGSFNESDFIIDASTSIAVSRYLVYDIESMARRISIFLNPSGTEFVALAEDFLRKIRLDYLEMFYYRMLLNSEYLYDHLRPPSGRIRYAASCRDISSTIQQDSVALYASIASKLIRSVMESPNPLAAIWQSNSITNDVIRVDIPIANPIIYKKKGWRIVTDDVVINTVYKARYEKLPNETGGVLLGTYDTMRKIIYVVDVLDAPYDSIEYPNAFIRGFRGLKAKLEKVERITAGNISYIGEWHSHPVGVDSKPSNDDKKVLNWIKKALNAFGYPGVMFIAGDKNSYDFYIEEK